MSSGFRSLGVWVSVVHGFRGCWCLCVRFRCLGFRVEGLGVCDSQLWGLGVHWCYDLGLQIHQRKEIFCKCHFETLNSEQPQTTLNPISSPRKNPGTASSASGRSWTRIGLSSAVWDFTERIMGLGDCGYRVP